jgi:tRNA(fMet)-specific endonuclease VapC
MMVLDTDILSMYFLGHPDILARRKAAIEAVATTIITRIETLRGRFDTLMKAADGEQLDIAFSRLVKAETDLREIRVLPIDERVCAEFDRLRDQKKLKKIGRADLLIASITLAHRATLVTRNLKHFQLVPGLKVENWAD